MGKGSKGRARSVGEDDDDAEEDEAWHFAYTLNTRPAGRNSTGALAFARVQEELEREKERRARAESEKERADEAAQTAQSQLAELRYSNRKLQERLNARAERSREALSSLRSGLEQSEAAAKKRASEGVERAHAALACLARAQDDPDASGSHLAALNRQLNQLVHLLDPSGTSSASSSRHGASRFSSTNGRGVAVAEDELERRASEAEGRAKAAEREVKALREKLKRAQDADQAIERLKARLAAAERRAAEEARARESLEHAASSTYSDHLREALSLISTRYAEDASHASCGLDSHMPPGPSTAAPPTAGSGNSGTESVLASDSFERNGGGAAFPFYSNGLPEHGTNDGSSTEYNGRRGPQKRQQQQRYSQHESELQRGSGADGGLPGVQRLREEMDALDAELAEQCGGDCCGAENE